MNVTYKLVSWSFDTAAFSSALMSMHDHFSYGEMAEIIGVSKSTVNNWARGNWSSEFPHPHLSNLLIVCNELDLDPREFFVLEDTV